MIPRTSPLPFDLRSLEIFLAVSETGAMAEAARGLGLTQPAVSQAIAELERKTGAALFDRAVRPLALTTAGGLLRQRASALLADARAIAPLLTDTKQGKLPLIRIGLVDSLARALTVPISTCLAGKADEVLVLSGLTASHASELLTRRLDLFIGVDDLGEMSGLERWELLVEPYILLLNRRHGAIRTLADLKRLARQHPLIRFSARSQTGLDIERHLRRLGIEVPQSFAYDSPYAVTAMVTAGVGWAVSTPLCVAEAAIASKDLVPAKLPGARMSRKLTLVARLRELGQLPRELADTAGKALKAALAGIPTVDG